MPLVNRIKISIKIAPSGTYVEFCFIRKFAMLSFDSSESSYYFKLLRINAFCYEKVFGYRCPCLGVRRQPSYEVKQLMAPRPAPPKHGRRRPFALILLGLCLMSSPSIAQDGRSGDARPAAHGARTELAVYKGAGCE